MTPSQAADPRVAAVRRFNRFYTAKIGVLRERLLDSPYSLTEVRVLYELAHRRNPTASVLARDLGLDPGYLSRVLRGLRHRGLLRKTSSDADRRRSFLFLTPKGRKSLAPLEARSNAQVNSLLSGLPEGAQARLIEAMQTIETLLGGAGKHDAWLLRPHRPGDIGWVISRHGALYAEEYGWDETFEALVAEIASRFLREFDARRERVWIAERDGANVGSVFLVRASEEVARLRLLLVEPAARGLGIGRRLVQECIAFARQVGYRKITLWTNDVLAGARHIYASAGFRLVEENTHRSFGHDLVGQTWDREL
jgi:DNA-binding MarR family transcriptional regulator/N-acetylglutamate synthase-like GNAT family acetyltransferase